MTAINLYILIKTVSDRTGLVCVLEMGDYRKAIVKSLPNLGFKEAFADAMSRITKRSVISLYTNRNSIEVHSAILAENQKQNHQVFYQNQKNDTSEKLEWLAYETALMNGSDKELREETIDGKVWS